MSQPPTDSEFSKTVEENHSSLRYFIRSLGAQSAWVDDLAQETFLVAYRKWSTLDHPDNAGSWLRAIARNLVMNESSKNNRRRRLIDENLTTILLSSESGELEPGELGDREIDHKALHQCLSKLTKRTRDIIQRRYFNDLNSTQIADQMTLSPSAVRKTLFTARRSLADCLSKQSLSPKY